MVTPTRLLVQVDGAIGWPPRGVAGLGIVVRNQRGQVLHTHSLRGQAATCNEAEYQALIAALQLVQREFPQLPAMCLTDSQIVVEQLAGRSAVRAAALIPLHRQARELLAQLPQVQLANIPRELNRLADALAWEGLAGRAPLLRMTR